MIVVVVVIVIVFYTRNTVNMFFFCQYCCGTVTKLCPASALAVVIPGQVMCILFLTTRTQF